MVAILTLTGTVVIALLLLDAGCYFWLRRNEATVLARVRAPRAM